MKGILFKTDMIKAIVDGRKSQTRRIMKPQPHRVKGQWYWSHRKLVYTLPHQDEIETELLGIWQAAPYHVGETVYVKEAWCEDFTGETIYYKADGNPSPGPKIDYVKGKWVARKKDFWRSPLFMPESAARYFLQIDAVKAERLQAITDEDCWAEGISEDAFLEAEHYSIGGSPLRGGSPARCAYAGLWDSINKANPWASNPWLFVYTFHQVAKPEGLR